MSKVLCDVFVEQLESCSLLFIIGLLTEIWSEKSEIICLAIVYKDQPMLGDGKQRPDYAW